MNIKRKFAFFTIVVCGISLISSVTLWYFQKNAASAAIEDKGKEAVARIEKVLALKSGYYRKQANDYAYWTDLLKYVQTKDARWAKDNLDGSLEEFGSNGVYVIGTDKTVIYSSVDREFLKDIYKIVDKSRLDTSSLEEIHFYAKTAEGIVEFFGSPIRHSSKTERTKTPYGYFFVVKHWDSKYINEIEQLGHIEAKIEDSYSKNTEELGNKISKDIALQDVGGRQIGVLHISIQNEIVQAIDDYAANAIKVELTHILIIIAAFMFLMTRYLTIPLTGISKALKLKEIEPIKKYLEQNNEYGNISRTIKDSFESRVKLKELNAQLEERVQEEVEKNRQKDQVLFQQSKNAAMGELIGLIAHQWRQPLNAVGIIMQTAYYDYKEGSLSEKDMEDCNTKGMGLIHSMSQTIDTFRNFFLPTTEKQIFCLEDSIDAAVGLVSALFEGMNIKINKQYAQRHNFFGYKRDFEQTILNLLLNAKDAIGANYTKNGSVNIFVTQNENTVSIEVSDNGGGVPQEVTTKMFDPYFTTKHQSQGVGIGLYMAKQIIEKYHDGKISAVNTEVGARFIIELPIQSQQT